MNWMFNLIIDAVPFWVWLVIIAIAAALTAQFWLPVWTALPRWLKATILGVGALIAAYGFGRNKGFRDEQKRRERANAEAINNRNEVNNEVGKLGSSDVDSRLDRWMRKD